jgi:hypothetical protein
MTMLDAYQFSVGLNFLIEALDFSITARERYLNRFRTPEEQTALDLLEVRHSQIYHKTGYSPEELAIQFKRILGAITKAIEDQEDGTKVTLQFTIHKGVRLAFVNKPEP